MISLSITLIRIRVMKTHHSVFILF